MNVIRQPEPGVTGKGKWQMDRIGYIRIEWKCQCLPLVFSFYLERESNVAVVWGGSIYVFQCVCRHGSTSRLMVRVSSTWNGKKNCETGPTRRTILVPTFHAGVILLGRLGDVLDLIDRQGRWKKAHSPIGSHTSPLNWLQDQIEMMCGPFVCAC